MGLSPASRDPTLHELPPEYTWQQTDCETEREEEREREREREHSKGSGAGVKVLTQGKR